MFLGKLSKEIFKCKFFIDDPFKTTQKKEINMNLLKRGGVFYEKLVYELQMNIQLFSILDWNNSSDKERDLNSNCLLTAEWIMAFAMGKSPQEIKNIRPTLSAQ